ncbi:MAG: apolipoprotein N-acyltransferase [Ignavibacteriales bacterium]|nr:apolipoprotein N-acyltransferase [Ignavibacteriales bacterium]
MNAKLIVHRRWLWRRWLLVIVSGIFLGASFPPSPLYSFAFVAFVPFFFVWEECKTYREAFHFTYLFLFVFHLITLYWQGGYAIAKDPWLMISNVALIFIHPLFYLPFLMGAFFVRRRTNSPIGLAAFAFLWISFDYLHSFGELSFPWITLGNSQAYDLVRIQIAEYTSVYGVSGYLFAFNIAAFLLLWNYAKGVSTWNSTTVRINLGVLVLAFFLPWVIGAALMRTAEAARGTQLKVGLVQPNFDPWEKWGEGFATKWDSYALQFHTFLHESKTLAKDSVDLLIWPETAIPFPILHPKYSAQREELSALVESLKTPVYTGFPVIEYFSKEKAPVTAQQIGTSNTYAESYNSAALFIPGGEISKVYRKVILVPYGERIPYAETFRFLIEPLKWNVGISSWGKGNDTVVVHWKRGIDTTRFGGMICYESAYPDYVRGFVRNGAEFLIVVTNDSWWGNTSGAYQHATFGSFRAIETRRWVVQCANGGISYITSPHGSTVKSIGMYEKANMVSSIETLSSETFYVRHGDLFALSCLFSGGLLVLYGVTQKKRLE